MNHHDQLFAKWNDWVQVIENDVINLLASQHIFWEVQKIIKANPKIHLASSFYEWMGPVYAVFQSIGLRRQVDPTKDTISFRRLLEEIARRPDAITRERYIALYEDPVIRRHVEDMAFDKFAGVGKPHINPEMVRKDCKQLIKKIEGMKDYVDRRVAHFAERGPTRLPTYGDVDDCLEFVEDLLKKYLAVIRADVRRQILPTWQYDWKQIFRHPWIPPESGG